MIENELEILKKVKHPNITKLVEDYRSNDFVYMILEFYRVIKKLRIYILFFDKYNS